MIMILSKEDFFAYHANARGRLLAYYAGNIVSWNFNQFTKLSNIVIIINGIEYRLSEHNVI
jgi:hypothetical protein